MAATFSFDPDRVAYFEANGWRAYYDRKWLKMLRLLVGLCQEQFRIPFPMSLLAAYYTTRASLAWVPVDHDEQKVLAFLEKLQYFDVHRQLVDVADKSRFVQALVDLHAAIFSLSPEQVRASAEWRALSASTVDLITGKKSTDVEGDWARLEEYLRRCYHSIQVQLNAA